MCDYCHLPMRATAASAGPAGDPSPVYCCYGCRLAARITQARGEQGQAVWMLTRLGVAVFLSMGVMVFSMYLYGQEIYGPNESTASPLAVSLAGFMRYASLVFATPVFFILGVPILANAAAQWRQRIVSTDALVVLGVGAAFVYSYISTLTDRGDTYYETACMILVLVTLGRWLEASGKLKASAAVEALEAMIPAEVSIQREGETIVARTEDVRTGDRVLVPAGERIPFDGVIESGQAQVDEQLVTGESTPMAKNVGDAVRAGTVNLDGALTIRATAVGSETTLGRLIALLEAAKRSKGRFQRLADRVAAVFLPLTMALAALGMVLGHRRGGWDEAIMSSLAVMLIACPCALGIATPTALWVALGRAASGGMLFRDGRVIEALAGIRAVCLDKTGTLTTGRPTVTSFVGRAFDRPAAPEDHPLVDEHRVLSLAAGLARKSNHAASRAIVAYVEQRGVTVAEVANVKTVAGRGLIGGGDGELIILGSVTMMAERSLDFDDATERACRGLMSEGRSIACIGWGGVVQGVFGLSETLRPEGPQAIADLQALGCNVSVLTGDHGPRGRSIAEALGVEVLAELMPEDKVRKVAERRHQYGSTAMVGDGLNDAPALAAADVGIAMGCGAEVTRESAGLCLLGNDLAALPWLIRLARRTVRTIKVNLFWAFAYNVVGMSLAVTGKLSPIFAAAAMVVSSLLVVGNSLRLGRGPPEGDQ